MKRDNGFEKDSLRAKLAGSKGKRSKGVKTIIRAILNLPAEELEEYIHNEKLPAKLQGLTVNDAIWIQAAIDAINGDKDSRRDIVERDEGKVAQKVEQKTEADITIKSPIAEAIEQAKTEGEKDGKEL